MKLFFWVALVFCCLLFSFSCDTIILEDPESDPLSYKVVNEFSDNPLVFQAENNLQTSSTGGTVASVLTGYTGTGYLVMSGASTDWLEWNFDLSDDETVIFTWFYNNNFDDFISYNVLINNENMGTKTFSPSDTSWNESMRSFDCNAGTNTIKLEATGDSEAIKFDKLEISGNSADYSD